MYMLHWLLATLCLVSLTSGQTCYWPNGATASNLQVCQVASNNDAAGCCFANHYCMTNGLCLSPTEGTWYRGGCTDQDFLQSGCPIVCLASASNAHVGVFNCGSDSNGSMRHACLDRGNCATENFTVGAYRAVMNAALSTDLFDSGATATESITSATGASTETTSAPTCTSTGQASGGITPGAAAGIGVGVGLPLAIAVGTLAFMLMREKRRSRGAQKGSQKPQDYSHQPYANMAHPPREWGGHYVATAEVPGQFVPHEMGDSERRPELDH